MPNTNAAQHQCSVCGRSFGRTEHLKRHEALHAGLRTFECKTCGKSFGRKDALLRHENVHGSEPNLVERGRRACRACAKSKTRCSGTLPCSRCRTRGSLCTYPEEEEAFNDSSDLGAQDSLVSSSTSDEPAQALRNRNPHSSTAVSAPLLLAEPQAFLPPPLQPSNIVQQAITVGNTEYAASSNHIVNIDYFDDTDWIPDVFSSINWLPTYLDIPAFDESLLPLIETPPEARLTAEDQVIHTTAVAQPQATSTSQSHPQPNPGLTALSPSHRSVRTEDSAQFSGSGEFYVDGAEARWPKIRRKRVIDYVISTQHASQIVDLSWPEYTETLRSPTCYITRNSWEALQQSFYGTQPYSPSGPESFLSLDGLNTLVHSFFVNVSATLSCIHEHTFSRRINSCSLQAQTLILAIATLGSVYVDEGMASTITRPLFEFWQLLLDTANADSLDEASTLQRAQSRLLFVVASNIFTNTALRHAGHRVINDLRLFLLHYTSKLASLDGEKQKSPEHTDWQSWTFREEQRRTLWLTWYVSLLRGKSNPQLGPSVPLSCMMKLSLPSIDTLWDAPNQIVFRNRSPSVKCINMASILHEIYVDKRLPADLGDLNHTLVVYAIIQRTWDVEMNLQQPLFGFQPSAEKRQHDNPVTTKIWPPADPIYAKWRNSACDCFDILHWRANAAIGLAGGFEPSLVLHLHLARLLILSPLDDIFRLGDAFARQGVPTTSKERTEASRAIHRWAISDPYKARLAAIHAGVTLWHIRRYSVNGFYEPFAALAATVTLWALSLHTSMTNTANANPRAREDAARNANSEPRSCEIILIDRPTDDELVQLFVREGESMRVILTGIPDLWAPGAARAVLEQGTKVLRTLGAWPGETEQYLSLLERLAMCTVGPTNQQ